MTTQTEKTEVTTDAVVEAPVAHAFDVFTTGIGSWWDTNHHILEAPLAEMVFEPYVGGNVVDRGVDGSECRWARVLAYEPPTRVCFSWDINLQWQLETDPARASEVEIVFTELSPGRTHVRLTHRHLDRHGEGWQAMRDAVASGWDLTAFAATAGLPSVLGRVLPLITDEVMRSRLSGARSYTAAILRVTPAYTRPAVDATVWEHGRRNMQLLEVGLLPIVLPVDDDTDIAGIGIFAATPDETRTIMDDDPGVRAGIFTYDLHPVRGFPGSVLS
ncbi:MAG TPA: SRPBCC family protein [Jatrophihabitans sp.]|jgi:uncharacterized protein YndB with AHSA1/START domain|nr:SRPBCC family protein [Jatrophihabitans sp.]